MFWDRYISLCNSIEKTPNAVAAENGVKSSGTVTGWKNGARPRENILRKLSDYFGVSVEWLMGDDKEKNPAPKTGDGMLPPEYYELTPKNRALVDSMIAQLLAAQSED